MKKIIYSLLSIIAITATFYSCVEDTEYDTPQIACEEPTIIGSEVSIETVIGQWFFQNDTDENGEVDWYETAYPLEFDTDYSNYIVGYVVSDDSTGNFYEELYLVDAPSSPSFSIKLAIDVSDLHTKYDIGRKVYVYLHDLAFNRVRGEMVLGELINGQVDEMRKNRAIENILRNCEATDITPVSIATPSAITASHLGMLIRVDNVQFDANLLGSPFVDPYDEYDSHRFLTSCDDDSQIRIETSGFASFRDSPLPEMKGSVIGVLTRDYGDDFDVLRISGPDALMFDDERCDPVYLDCGDLDVEGANVLFSDDFEAYATNETNLPGWTNINVNGGDNLFEVRSYSNNKYVQCSAYQSEETPLEVWLITNAINMDASTDEVLSFKTKTGFNNGAALSVLISNDYSGDIAAATWIPLDAELANGPDDEYESNFTDSGIIDISCLDGDVFIAFKYLGGDGGITTTFQVDDVKVTGN